MVMGLTIGLSFCLLVVGAAITSAWVLFVDLVFVLCLPIIIVLFHMVNPKHDNWEDMTIAQRQTANFGTCVVAAVMSCLLGLPLVLLHTGEINGTAFGFWIASTLLSASGTLYYMYHSQDKEE